MLNNYGGVFDCFYPGRGIVRTLIMAGDFGADDMYKVSRNICEDFVEQFTRKGDYNMRHIVGVD